MITKSTVVRVTQLAAELEDPDDRIDLPAGDRGRGSFRDYEIADSTLDWANEKASDAILDAFHNTVAIGCLDDFTVEIVDTAAPPAKLLETLQDCITHSDACCLVHTGAKGHSFCLSRIIEINRICWAALRNTDLLQGETVEQIRAERDRFRAACQMVVDNWEKNLSAAAQECSEALYAFPAETKPASTV